MQVPRRVRIVRHADLLDPAPSVSLRRRGPQAPVRQRSEVSLPYISRVCATPEIVKGSQRNASLADGSTSCELGAVARPNWRPSHCFMARVKQERRDGLPIYGPASLVFTSLADIKSIN